MHPTKLIKNQKSDTLQNKKIILGVTGSIAAIMSIKLSRELIRHGAEVKAVMTNSAKEIIHPYSLKYATGNKVIDKITGEIEHVKEVGENGEADLLLIAPSTANTIGKIASGIDDTPVTTFATTALSTDLPILIAPAMHESMYKQPIISEKINNLKQKGIRFIEPNIKKNKAKLSELREIIFEVKKALTKNDLTKMNILVTGGATFTELDEVRILTNKSTGETGKELAQEAAKRGANVTFIHGELDVKKPIGVSNKYSPTYDEMKKTILTELKENKFDLLISSAAISDFKAKKTNKKINSDQSQEIKLNPTEKIIKKVNEEHPELNIISFKLEKNTKEIKKRSRTLLEYSNFVIGNKINEMDNEEKEYYFIEKDKVNRIKTTKNGLAKNVFDKLI